MPGDIIKYADLKFDDPSNYRVGEINVLTYTYYKDKSSMIEAPSLSKPSGYSYKYNSLKPSTFDQGIRSAWDHGDTMTYHVHYRVFDRDSKYGVPVFEDIAPYDTVIVPKNGSIKVNAKVIPGYTLDSQHMFNMDFNSSDKTMTIQSGISEDGYFSGVVDKNGIPMVSFTYFKDNSESAFKDSMTPAVSSLNTSGKTLTYTVRKYYNGRLWSYYQPNIEPGESKQLFSFSIGALGQPDTTLYGTPGYFEVTYDDVKAGKNLYEFWRYQPDFFNADGTPKDTATPSASVAPAVSTTPATSEAPAVSTTPATSETPEVSTAPATSETPAVSTTPATSLVPSKDIHSMNSVTYSSTQTRNAGIKSEADGKLTSHDLPKTGDTNSKVGMLGMIFVGLGLTSFVYKGRHRRSK